MSQDKLEAVPGEVRRHLVGLAEDDSVEALLDNWLKKKELLERQMSTLEMVSQDSFSRDETRGMLLLTYSGSLIALGPAEEGGSRWMEYASIKLRTDVPEILRRRGVQLKEGAGVDKPLLLEGGPVQKTSALHLVSLCPEGLSFDEQDKRIREAMLFLTNGFVRINRTLPSAAGAPDQELFTNKALVKTLSDRHGLTQKQTKALLEDYQVLLEAGMILGERVPLGKMGKLFLNVRPPQPSRVMKIPGTDRETTVSAKPATAVPKFSFSKGMKEKAALVDPEVLGYKEDS